MNTSDLDSSLRNELGKRFEYLIRCTQDVSIDTDLIEHQLDSLCRDILFLRENGGVGNRGRGDASYSGITDEIVDLCLKSYHIVNEFNKSRDQNESLQMDIMNGRARRTEEPTGQRGRPRVMIAEGQLKFLLGHGFTIPEIAKLLHVSPRTVSYRLQSFNLEAKLKYTDIDDYCLEAEISRVMSLFPNAGERSIQGHLQSKKIVVQRHRVRSIMQSINPHRQQFRRLQTIRRRKYSVQSPLSMWHIDGNHKLIRWRLVVHGGVDGYSRLIVYLQASPNNLSSTVMKLFDEAVQKWGLPSRVRSDLGVENRDVAEFMLNRRGTGRRSFITGKSVHNSRIERLWRDVFEAVLSSYYQLFYHLEDSHLLDPSDDKDIYILHYVYLSKLNGMLTQFSEMWNNHKIRTGGNKSPLQLFIMGMHAAADYHNNMIANEYFEQRVPQDFGADYEEALQLQDEDRAILVPTVSDPFESDHQVSLFEIKSAELEEQCKDNPFWDTKYYTLLRETLQSIINE
ncbi:uncharacterized protein LOC106178403 [Lingula anatina]|uniref:Uncharacterized protein LOC106178403 n=1 Tax=Lingula anatina TaxID=7574 RepID=A0A1S3K3L8_LINAN|nr:uncharacterized protein LOC106178403 [Lingula anatina]|eukprot:XP_013417009.1 uncharacterized protein LOC106178403 [Lingula anatina]